MKIGLGGGCHWCTEAVFQALHGVSMVEQGFIRSNPPYQSWSEAVMLTFDPAEIPLSTLIEIHLRTHASTSDHSKRGKYRSAVYIHDALSGLEVARILLRFRNRFGKPLVTQILPFQAFKLSDEKFRNYYQTGPKRPFCKAYIDPKLELLRTEFTEYLRQAEFSFEETG